MAEVDLEDTTADQNPEQSNKDGYRQVDENPTPPKGKSDMPGLPDFMQDERVRIQAMYTVKKKMLDKWVGMDNSFKQIQLLVVAFTMVGAAGVGIVAGIKMSPALSFTAAGLAAFGALKEPLAKLFITEFTTKKRVKFMNICKVIKECLDAMYLSYIQANQDGEISVEEVRKYQVLIQTMEAKLFDIEADAMVV